MKIVSGILIAAGLIIGGLALDANIGNEAHRQNALYFGSNLSVVGAILMGWALMRKRSGASPDEGDALAGTGSNGAKPQRQPEAAVVQEKVCPECRSHGIW